MTSWRAGAFFETGMHWLLLAVYLGHWDFVQAESQKTQLCSAVDCRLNLNARIVRCGKKVNAPWQPAVIAFIVLAEVFCTTASVGAGVDVLRRKDCSSQRWWLQCCDAG